jgi:hypothetical protein
MKALALGVALLAGFAAGCGDDEDARRAVVAAAEKTTDGGPVGFHQRALVKTGEDEYVDMTFRGTADAGSGTARFEVSTARDGEAAPSKAAAALDKLDGEMAVAPGRTYARLPEITDNELAAGGRWVHFREDDPAIEDTGLSALSDAGSLDVSRPVDHARAATSVRREEAEEMNGVPTTRYRMAIDFERYLEIADPRIAGELRPDVEAVEDYFKTTRFPAKAWIDDGGRIVRFDGDYETATGDLISSYRITLVRAGAPPVIPDRSVPLRKLAGR